MNKTQLIEKVSEKTGDKKTAALAVNAFVDAITTTVATGEKVVIPGFGTWEKKSRPARAYHNPATGERGTVPATDVPKFKAGAEFRASVKGARVPA